VGQQNLDKYGVRPKFIRYILGYLVLFLGTILARINIKGTENIPKKGPFIVVCNHFNRLDPPFVIYAIKKPINFLMASDQTVEAEIMWAPWLYGFIPTNRQKMAPSTIKRSINALKKREIVGIFPEGTATEQYLRHAKKGAAYLAMVTKVPIVPMSIIGMDKIWEKWFKCIKPNLMIRIGKPFLLGELPKEAKKRNAEMLAAGDEIMLKIGALLPRAYHGEYANHKELE
jgi:1-acyl-sn-glycerol-3-phosphate acyltransferase